MIHKRNIAFLCTLMFGIFLFASSASAATLQKPPNNLGLVGYWPMNEGTSTQAGDFSGRGNTGTLTGMANPPTATSGWGNGKLGGGLNFDGTNDYINLPNTLSDISGTVSTVSMWIKLTAYDTFGCIPFSMTNIYWQISSNTAVYVQGSGVTITSTPFADGTWRYLTMTSETNSTKVYVNGVLVGSWPAPGASIPAGAKNAAIGDYINGPAASWSCKGQLDDVRIYNRALSVAEIANLYKSGSAKLNSSQNNKVTNGLVGLWSFDGADMSGNTAYDRSPSGNNGTLTNGPVRAIGKVGQGLSFDGVDDYVGVTSSGSVENLSAMTLSAWIKPNSVNAGYILVKGTGTTNPANGWNFRINTSQQLDFRVGYNTTDLIRISSDAVPLNTWSYISMTWDGSSSAANVHLYINGVETTYITTQNGASSRDSDTASAIRVGVSSGGSSPFSGSMDDVRIYNRTLTQAETTQLYNMGGSKLNAPQNNIPGSTLQSGLVGLWSFNGPDMSGNTAYNRGTASGANGTLTGGPARAIGKVGQGMSFDGVDDYVDVPYTNLDFERTDPHSFSFWIKYGDVANTQSALGRYSGNRGIIIATKKTAVAGLRNAWSMGVAIQSGVGNIISLSSPTNSFVPSRWYHVSITYDGSSTAAGVHIYIDGTEQVKTVFFDTLTATIKPAVNWQLGNDQTSDPLQGSLDEMRIYNRVLTQAEVTQLYLLGK